MALFIERVLFERRWLTMNNFDFYPQGDEMLAIMQNAVRYTDYLGKMVREVLPASGNLLEVGSGDGQQTLKIIGPTDRLTLVETSPRQVEALTTYGYTVATDLAEFIGTELSGVFTLNCLEHIEDDSSLVRTIHDCLKVEGLLIIYVPAIPALYSSMDKRVGHFRRYTKGTLSQLLSENGFQISEIRFVDSLGVIPSLIYRFIPRASGEPSPLSIRIYDRLLFPISRLCDRLFSGLIGKNLFVVAKKCAAAA
jgi:SAM-dependent methyltransferase